MLDPAIIAAHENNGTRSTIEMIKSYLLRLDNGVGSAISVMPTSAEQVNEPAFDDASELSGYEYNPQFGHRSIITGPTLLVGNEKTAAATRIYASTSASNALIFRRDLAESENLTGHAVRVEMITFHAEFRRVDIDMTKDCIRQRLCKWSNLKSSLKQ